MDLKKYNMQKINSTILSETKVFELKNNGDSIKK